MIKTLTLENKYGSLRFLVGAKQQISELCSADFPEGVFFDLETAEKIALITENRKIQICFRNLKEEKAYLLYYFSASEVGLCFIQELDFSSPVMPSEEIERLQVPFIF
ncbi:MAG: hypothetical protein RBR08_14505 [Desulforegulaceae bacterium]|nr:hypothetical protein [Desulforegulaceae bacterium]